MQRPQLKHRLNKDLVIEILLGIIVLELVFDRFNPGFFAGLGYALGVIIAATVKLAFYLAIIVVCFSIGRKLGDYLKTHLN